MEPLDEYTFMSKFYEEKPDSSFHKFKINGTRFAIFLKEISSDKDLTIELQNYNVFLLASLESERNITILAKSLVCFSVTHAKTGKTEMHASGTITMLGAETDSN